MLKKTVDKKETQKYKHIIDVVEKLLNLICVNDIRSKKV